MTLLDFIVVAEAHELPRVAFDLETRPLVPHVTQYTARHYLTRGQLSTIADLASPRACGGITSRGSRMMDRATCAAGRVVACPRCSVRRATGQGLVPRA